MATRTFDQQSQASLVSIVVPARNGVRFLDETFRGISNQSFDRWELIFVEDGSDDGSREKVEQFSVEHPDHRVIYLRNETSQGVSCARNRGTAKARGEYIAYLDCDDYWLPTHLTAACEALRDSAIDAVYSTVQMFSDTEGTLLDLWGPNENEVTSFPQSLFYRNFITPSSTVWKHEALSQIGAWDSRFHGCQDADYFLRAGLAGIKLHHLSGIHCMYRKEQEGAITRHMADTIEELALVTERYRNNPVVCLKEATRAVAGNFQHAAKLHARTSRDTDPSSHPSRAASLYFKAWKLRPQRWENLLKACYCRLRHGPAGGREPFESSRRPPEVVLASDRLRDAA